jgi:hypothetical protein
LYIQRTDRGDRLLALHLVGPRTADAWQAGDTATVDGALAAVRDGAAWVKERLSASERHTLATICLDPDGSICSWLTAPSADPAIVQAVARGMGEGHGHEGEHEEHPGAPGVRALDPFASVGSGMALQAITSPDPAANGHTTGEDTTRKGRGGEAGQRKRLAVLGVPDSVASLLIDTLDTLGVAAPPAISLWHAMARAWDPGAPGNARGDGPRLDRLVAEVVPVTAIMLVEPQGRLTWAWSRQGVLLTGGSIRLARGRAGAPPAGRNGTHETEPTRLEPVRSDAPVPRLDASQGARLAAEWLSWSAQTGVAPGRVVLLTPDRAAGLTPAEFAGTLVKAWPGAMVDLISHDDPVIHTLQRAIEDDAPVAAAGTITALTTRPSRAHRSMYVWTALAIAALAVAAGVAAIMSWRTAADARARAAERRRDTSAAVMAHYDDPTAAAAGVLLTLEDDLQRAQAAGAPADQSQLMPVLEELENISLAVSSLIASSPGCELRSLTVDNLTGARLTVRFPGTTTPDLAAFEDFRLMLREIGAGRLTWNDTGLGGRGPQGQGSGQGAEATFTGLWPTARPGGGAP